MKWDDALLYASKIIFYFIAFIVIWNMIASPDWRFLSDMGRKFWAMAGLGLYIIILLEKRRRSIGDSGQDE